MNWKYISISFLIGIIIGLVSMYFSNRKLHRKKIVQCELQKNKKESEKYFEELIKFLSESTDLLDKIAFDYRRFYQNMVKNSSIFISEMAKENNSFQNFLSETEFNRSQVSPKDPPRDYPEKMLKKFYIR